MSAPSAHETVLLSIFPFPSLCTRGRTVLLAVFAAYRWVISSQTARSSAAHLRLDPDCCGPQAGVPAAWSPEKKKKGPSKGHAVHARVWHVCVAADAPSLLFFYAGRACWEASKPMGSTTAPIHVVSFARCVRRLPSPPGGDKHTSAETPLL